METPQESDVGFPDGFSYQIKDAFVELRRTWVPVICTVMCTVMHNGPGPLAAVTGVD